MSDKKTMLEALAGSIDVTHRLLRQRAADQDSAGVECCARAIGQLHMAIDLLEE